MWNILNYFTEDSIVVKDIFMCMSIMIDSVFKKNLMWACFPKISVKLYHISAKLYYFEYKTLYLGSFIWMWKGITGLDLCRAVQSQDSMRRRANE